MTIPSTPGSAAPDPNLEKIRQLLAYLVEEVDYQDNAHLNAAFLAQQTFETIQTQTPRPAGRAEASDAESIHTSNDPPRQCRFCGSTSAYVSIQDYARSLFYLICTNCKARHPIDYSAKPTAIQEQQQ